MLGCLPLKMLYFVLYIMLEDKFFSCLTKPINFVVYFQELGHMLLGKGLPVSLFLILLVKILGRGFFHL